jgi:membrane protein
MPRPANAARPRSALRSGLERAWRFVVRVADRYNADRGPLIAAAVAFFALLSILPFVLLSLAVLGRYIGVPGWREAVHHFLVQFLQEQSVVSYLENLARDQGAIAGVGAVGLAWSTAQLFSNVEMAMDVAWRAPTGRHYLLSRALAFAMTVVAYVLLLAATLTTWILHGLHDVAQGWLSREDWSWVWSGADQVLPFVVTVLALAGVYRFMPNTRVQPAAAWVGALVAAILWEGAKWLFALYLSRLQHSEPIYGSLAGLVALFIWLYYSAAIFMVGAEVGAIYQENPPALPRLRVPRKAAQVSPRHATGGPRSRPRRRR